MDQQERDRYLTTLAATPGRLKGALSGVPKKLLLWTPAPGKWSIQEIVCHMRDMEREAYLERYRRILAEDNPTLPDIDGDAYAIERDYRSLRLGEVLRDWAKLRKESLRLLRKVKGAQWERIGTHETAGPFSVETFLRRHAVGNDEAHLGQIDAIRRRHEILTALESAPAALAEATRDLSGEALRRQPSPDKWSIIEIACHLRDIERVYAERFTKMAHQERPTFWMLDNARVAGALRYREADLRAAIKEWRRLRDDTVALLRSLPHASWQRTGLHPKRGELTLEQLAGVLAGHDRSHLDRIRDLRAG
ncbi:MAG: DinB family protein [Vicinamibacteria bacterium]